MTAAAATLTGKRIYYLTDAKIADLLNVDVKRVREIPIAHYMFIGLKRYSSVDLAEYVVSCRVPAKPPRVPLTDRPRLSLVEDDAADDSDKPDTPAPAA